MVIINFVVGSKLLTDVEAWRSHFRHSYLIGMECDPGIGSCKYFWVMYGKTGESLIITINWYTIAQSHTNMLQ